MAHFSSIQPFAYELNIPFEQVVTVKRQKHLFAVCIIHRELFWLTDNDGMEGELEQLFIHVTSDEDPPLGVNHMDYIRMYAASEYCEPAQKQPRTAGLP